MSTEATPTAASPRTSRLLRSPVVRWAVPAGAALAVAAGVAVTSGSADAAAQLPPKTAAQLLADVARAPQHPLSGTVVETASLGLPELPGQAAGTSLQSLITGSHTARVWYGTDAKARISLVGDLAETDVVRNGQDLWLWSSTTNEAQHYTMREAKGAAADHAEALPSVPPSVATDPTAAARQALAAVDPTTAVRVDGTGHVAGRPVYELSLTPRDKRSTIGSVRIAIDSATSVPLRLRIFAKGAGKPAFETGFTEVQFQQPAASIFTFTPPKGAKVVEGGSPLGGEFGAEAGGPGSYGGSSQAPANPPSKAPLRAPSKAPSTTPAKPASPSSGQRVIGKGWTAVAVMPGFDFGALAQDSTGRAVTQATRPVSGAFGNGRLLKTALVNVLVVTGTDTAYIGAVDPSVLEQAASSGS